MTEGMVGAMQRCRFEPWITLLVFLTVPIMVTGVSTNSSRVTVIEGSNVTLNCSRHSLVPVPVLWNFHAIRNPILDEDTIFVAEISSTGNIYYTAGTWANDIRSSGTSNLVISRLRLDRDEGYFTCSSMTSTLITINVIVQVPVKTVSLSPDTIVTLSTWLTEATLFTCTVTSKPNPTVTWQLVTTNTSTVELHGFTETTTTHDKLIDVTSTLSYTPQKEHNGDCIRCTASSPANTSPAYKDTRLIIHYPPNFINAISGYTNPATESRSSMQLTCSVSGGANPANTLIYSWSSDCGTGTGTKSQQISVSRNRTMNNKQCSCTVTHPETGWQQNSTRVTFNIYYVPDVTVSVHKRIVTEGGSTQLECHTSAVPDIYTSIDWTHHVNGVKVRELSASSMSKLLNLSNLTFEDTGEYRCSAENIVGTGTGTESITIKYAPKLVGSNNASSGMNGIAVLSLTFIGDPEPNVTWYRDGSNSPLDNSFQRFSTNIARRDVSWTFYETSVTIPGYEATLTIYYVQEQDYASYHATIDNGLRTDSRIPRFSARLIQNVSVSTPSPNADSPSAVVAVAVAVPSVCIIVILIIVICIVLRRLRAKKLNMAVSNGITLSDVISAPPDYNEDNKDALYDEIHNIYDSTVSENDVDHRHYMNDNPASGTGATLQTTSLGNDGGYIEINAYEPTSFGDGAVQYKNTRSENAERNYEKLNPDILADRLNQRDSI